MIKPKDLFKLLRLLQKGATAEHKSKLQRISLQLTARADIDTLMTALIAEQERIDWSLAYQAANSKNTAATELLARTAPLLERKYPNSFGQTGTPPERQLVPVDLVNFYNLEAAASLGRSTRLNQCDDITADNKTYYFFPSTGVDKLREIEWRTGGDADEATLTPSHRTQRRIHRLIDPTNADNAYLADQLAELQQRNTANAKKYFKMILIGLTKNYPLYDLISIALQRNQISLAKSLLIDIGHNKNQQYNRAINTWCHHILTRNDIDALSMLIETIPGSNKKLLTLSRTMYYRHPDNTACLLAYVEQLKKIGKHRCSKAELNEIYTLGRIAHERGDDNGTYLHICKLTISQTACVELAMALFRDNTRSDAIKIKVFRWLLKQEQYVMDNEAYYRYYAECYRHGYGCTINLTQANKYLAIADELATPVEATSPEAYPGSTPDHLSHRYTLRHLTRIQDGTQREMQLSACGFFLMSLGASNKTYTVRHMQQHSRGYYNRYAAVDYNDFTETYITTLDEDQRAHWQCILNDQQWSQRYLSSELTTDDDNQILPRLRDKHFFNINAAWYDWDSAHSYLLTFFEFNGQVYMIKGNRGGRRNQDISGLTLYQVGNTEALSSQANIKQLLKRCNDQTFCEGMESTVENTIGHTLGLTKLFNLAEKSSQKGGTCALATIQKRDIIKPICSSTASIQQQHRIQ